MLNLLRRRRRVWYRLFTGKKSVRAIRGVSGNCCSVYVCGDFTACMYVCVYVWVCVAGTISSSAVSLVDQDLEGNRTLAVAGATAIENILRPGAAFNADHLIDGQFLELYGNQRTHVVGLIHEGIIVGGETLTGIEFNVGEFLFVQA